MSSSHPFTAVDDDDDTDICPVCDGQCTCRLELDVNSQPTPPAPPVPSLKIKFTLPQNLIVKRQQVPLSDAYTNPLKKRGRPPKHTLTLPEKPQKDTAKINKVRQTLKARAAAISKKVVKRRRIAVESDQDESYSSEGTFDTSYKHYQDDPQLIKRSPTHDWIIRPREKSVGGSDAEQMDVDTDTDDQAHNQNNQDDEDEDDEDEPDGLGVEEDDEDTDGRHRYVGLATGWSSEDEESSFDADLFFANLSDSSSCSGSSSTSTRRRCHSCTPGGIDADQSSSTSESPSKTALPFEVTENWDGHLIFTNGLVGDAESRGIVDNDFEKRFADDSGADDDQLNYHPPSIAQAPESSDTDMFSISDVDAGYEEDRGEADEGDTTDEELVGDDSLPNEQAMRLFTLPMPISMGISAINPMSIVSPVGFEKRGRRKGMSVDEDHEEREIWKRRLRSGPRAADILAGKTVFWEDESGDGYASSSSNSMVRSSKGKQRAFSPSSPTSYISHPRQNHVPNTPRRGLFVPTGETRQAVIGDDRKGIDVPSPHPRFYGTVTTPGGDEYDTGNSTPYPCPTEVEVNDLACIVELDDVLEASFLDDSMDRECEASLASTSGSTSGGVELEDPSSNLTTATTISSTAAVEASNKHLTRWDVISIGAFRQTREQQQQQVWESSSRSPSTVGDYRGATKNGASAAGSPLSALLWQNSGSMSSPLVLPLSSTSLSTPPSKSRSSARTAHSHSHSQSNDPSPTQKTRKERRREKKLLKKKISSSPSSSMPRQFFSTHPNNASNNHHFHTHQHHPNSKTRGMSSSQRMGYFGGAVPPLNL